VPLPPTTSPNPDAEPPTPSAPTILSLPVSGPNRARLEAPLTNAARNAAASLYIHVPFCFHKCHYCDFYSIVDNRDRQAPFVDRLITELQALSHWARRPINTIFVGGGTPSLLIVPLWERLLEHLNQLFDARSIPDRGGEFTVECNPETVTQELADTLIRGGVNRISMGAQSFNPTHLKTLERWHDPVSIPRAMEYTRAAGIKRHSIDLIFGIPGQTMSDWMADLNAAISLGTEHLSCYGLTYEPGTAMTARLKRGEFTPADDDLEADMFDATATFLARESLQRYEISNFAKPGAQCRHNLAYWRQENWLAAGPSASGHINGLRWKNVPRLDDYLMPTPSGRSFVSEYESPEPRRNLLERIMTGLRLSEGLDSANVLALAGSLSDSTHERVGAWAASEEQSGMLQMSEGRWLLTEAGLRLTNSVLLRASEALDPP
jgi:oxygen-independent coproporphyrinogen-3 oxidase